MAATPPAVPGAVTGDALTPTVDATANPSSSAPSREVESSSGKPAQQEIQAIPGSGQAMLSTDLGRQLPRPMLDPPPPVIARGCGKNEALSHEAIYWFARYRYQYLCYFPNSGYTIHDLWDPEYIQRNGTAFVEDLLSFMLWGNVDYARQFALEWSKENKDRLEIIGGDLSALYDPNDPLAIVDVIFIKGEIDMFPRHFLWHVLNIMRIGMYNAVKKHQEASNAISPATIAPKTKHDGDTAMNGSSSESGVIEVATTNVTDDEPRKRSNRKTTRKRKSLTVQTEFPSDQHASISQSMLNAPPGPSSLQGHPIAPPTYQGQMFEAVYPPQYDQLHGGMPGVGPPIMQHIVPNNFTMPRNRLARGGSGSYLNQSPQQGWVENVQRHMPRPSPRLISGHYSVAPSPNSHPRLPSGQHMADPNYMPQDRNYAMASPMVPHNQVGSHMMMYQGPMPHPGMGAMGPQMVSMGVAGPQYRQFGEMTNHIQYPSTGPLQYIDPQNEFHRRDLVDKKALYNPYGPEKPAFGNMSPSQGRKNRNSFSSAQGRSRKFSNASHTRFVAQNNNNQADLNLPKQRVREMDLGSSQALSGHHLNSDPSITGDRERGCDADWIGPQNESVKILLIFDVPIDATVEDLKALFEQEAGVTDAKFSFRTDKMSNRYTLVEFERTSDASRALKLNHHVLRGNTLNIKVHRCHYSFPAGSRNASEGVADTGSRMSQGRARMSSLSQDFQPAVGPPIQPGIQYSPQDARSDLKYTSGHEEMEAPGSPQTRKPYAKTSPKTDKIMPSKICETPKSTSTSKIQEIPKDEALKLLGAAQEAASSVVDERPAQTSTSLNLGVPRESPTSTAYEVPKETERSDAQKDLTQKQTRTARGVPTSRNGPFHSGKDSQKKATKEQNKTIADTKQKKNSRDNTVKKVDRANIGSDAHDASYTPNEQIAYQKKPAPPPQEKGNRKKKSSVSNDTQFEASVDSFSASAKAPIANSVHKLSRSPVALVPSAKTANTPRSVTQVDKPQPDSLTSSAGRALGTTETSQQIPASPKLQLPGQPAESTVISGTYGELASDDEQLNDTSFHSAREESSDSDKPFSGGATDPNAPAITTKPGGTSTSNVRSSIQGSGDGSKDNNIENKIRIELETQHVTMSSPGSLQPRASTVVSTGGGENEVTRSINSPSANDTAKASAESLAISPPGKQIGSNQTESLHPFARAKAQQKKEKEAKKKQKKKKAKAEKALAAPEQPYTRASTDSSSVPASQVSRGAGQEIVPSSSALATTEGAANTNENVQPKGKLPKTPGEVSAEAEIVENSSGSSIENAKQIPCSEEAHIDASSLDQDSVTSTTDSQLSPKKSKKKERGAVPSLDLSKLSLSSSKGSAVTSNESPTDPNFTPSDSSENLLQDRTDSAAILEHNDRPFQDAHPSSNAPDDKHIRNAATALLDLKGESSSLSSPSPTAEAFFTPLQTPNVTMSVGDTSGNKRRSKKKRKKTQYSSEKGADVDEEAFGEQVKQVDDLMSAKQPESPKKTTSYNSYYGLRDKVATTNDNDVKDEYNASNENGQREGFENQKVSLLQQMQDYVRERQTTYQRFAREAFIQDKGQPGRELELDEVLTLVGRQETLHDMFQSQLDEEEEDTDDTMPLYEEHSSIFAGYVNDEEDG